MPKKTKREKIIAEYRRKLLVVSARPQKMEMTREPLSVPSTSGYVPTFTLTQSVSKNESHEVLSLDPQEFLAIKKDLIRTLGLTGLILIGQIIIWRVIG